MPNENCKSPGSANLEEGEARVGDFSTRLDLLRNSISLANHICNRTEVSADKIFGFSDVNTIKSEVSSDPDGSILGELDALLEELEVVLSRTNIQICRLETI